MTEDFFIVSNFRSDLAYFDGLSETILCAGLVKPKPGMLHIILIDVFVLVCRATESVTLAPALSLTIIPFFLDFFRDPSRISEVHFMPHYTDRYCASSCNIYAKEIR